jgi:nucleotide-binding universal stress UspA family protein
MPVTLDSKRILAPLTLPGGGEIKIPVIAEQARAFDADVIVLHVLAGTPSSPAGEVSLEESVARTYLDAVTAQLRATGVRAEPLLRFGRPVAAVHEVAVEQEVSMIILGRPPRKGMARLLPGGQVDEIAREAPCPVLVVEPEPEGHIPALRRFDDDLQRSGAAAPRFLGPRTVDLMRVVGAVTRAADLGSDFRPLRKRPEEETHYRQVLKAMEQRPEQVPPVELYKLGYGYYVFSGHAQVAAAKQLGQAGVEALVTEYVPLANLDAQRILDERSAFERMTGLLQIGAARVGCYARLQALIDAFARHHGIADRQEAARRWYATIFRPAQRLLREQRLAERFPGERSADVLLRVAAYMETQRTAHGRELSWEEAIRALAVELRPGQRAEHAAESSAA